MTTTINEFDGGYGATEINPTPIISITPGATDCGKEIPALCAPPPAECDVSNIFVIPEGPFIVSAESVDDAIIMDIVFSVSCNGISGRVTKKIQVSKSRLLADVKIQNMATPIAMVEAITETKKPVGKSQAQRMRELAGIPHKGNFT